MVNNKPIGFLTIILLSFFYNGLAQTPYNGKMKITLAYNGVPVPGFEGDFEDVYLYNNRYFFEKLITQSTYSEYELQPAATGVITKSKLTKSTFSENITGYLLTDLLTGICIEFDSSKSHPKVIKTFPLQEKNKGIRLYPEQITFLDVATDLLRYTSDTAIHGRTYKLLTENKPRSKNAQGQLLIKTIAWLDNGLKGFPFHISRKLDEQFNGFIGRIDQQYQGGNIISYIYQYKGGLSFDEMAKIKRFIATAGIKKRGKN